MDKEAIAGLLFLLFIFVAYLMFLSQIWPDKKCDCSVGKDISVKAKAEWKDSDIEWPTMPGNIPVFLV